MLDMNDPEDRQIRNILIALATGALGFVLVLALVITICVSANFNVLGWME